MAFVGSLSEMKDTTPIFSRSSEGTFYPFTLIQKKSGTWGLTLRPSLQKLLSSLNYGDLNLYARAPYTRINLVRLLPAAKKGREVLK